MLASARKWIVLGTALVLPACSGSRTLHKHPAFVTEADAAWYLSGALDGDNPDVRRDQIVQLSKTRWVTRETVVRGLALVARTDSSPSVRCAAIRGLGGSRSPAVVEPVLQILAAKSEHDPAVVAPDATVRWDAVAVLSELLAARVDVGSNGDAIRVTGIRLLGNDPSRDVRVVAAELLGSFQETDVLDALIAGLEQRDFGVVYECERSLMRITGQSHDHDPVAWRQWRQQAGDPFADAGRLDDKLSRRQPHWLRRTWDSTRRTLASFRPKDG
jgi:hypothetical protein